MKGLKKTVQTACMLLFVHTSFAQDVITTRDLKKINAQIVEMNLEQVTFKYADNLNGSAYMLQKKDLISIYYQDGRVELFQAANVHTASSLVHDVITTKNLKKINVHVVEVNINQVKFKYADNLNGSTYMLQKKDLISIHYQDGRVELFQAEGAAEGAQTSQRTQNQPNNQQINQNPLTTQPRFVQPKTIPLSVAQPMSKGREERASINFGFMMGGGLVGLDLEFLVSERIGLQIGAAYCGLDVSVNYHIEPYINSSFVSIQYTNIGFGPYKVGATLGPMFNFRAKKIFQAGIGIGAVVSRGPLWTEAYKKDVTMLIQYNIGLYFPL